MIHTSLSPNTQSDDILLAASIILRPFVWKNETLVKKFETALATYLNINNVVTVDSGRTALYTLLKAYGINQGDEVLVQAYTCVAVPEPILWLEAVPVYVDCRNDFTMNPDDLEKKITSKSKVVVVQHTFGKAADMESIVAVCKKHNLFIIEDCAHALGGIYDNKMLGTIGDAAFFSFGRDKVISSVFGGAIVAKDHSFSEKVENIVKEYPLPRNKWVLQQLLHPLVLSISKLTYNFFSLGKIWLEFAKRTKLISKAVESVELSGGVPSFVFRKYSPALAVLATHQIEKLSQYIEHRRSIAKVYSEKLSLPYDPNHAYLRFTISLDSIAPKEVFARAKEKGIQLGDWYTTVLAPKKVVYSEVGYKMGSCPNAERLASHTINLPTHIGIKPDMIDSICSVLGL